MPTASKPALLTRSYTRACTIAVRIESKQNAARFAGKLRLEPQDMVDMPTMDLLLITLAASKSLTIYMAVVKRNNTYDTQ